MIIDDGHRVVFSGDTLGAVARSYGGFLHGADIHGRWDVEFPDVHSAAAFAATVGADDWGTGGAWHAVLRDPVTDLKTSCVLTVSAYPKPS